MLTGFHFVELLRTDRLPFVEVLVTLQRRFRQGQGGIRCDELLLGSNAGCGRTVHSGSRLRIVDYGEHLTSLHAVSFMGTNFDNVSHHLTREIAGLGRVHCSDCFQQIGNVGLLHCQHRNVPHGFCGRRR